MDFIADNVELINMVISAILGAIAGKVHEKRKSK